MWSQADHWPDNFCTLNLFQPIYDTYPWLSTAFASAFFSGASSLTNCKYIYFLLWEFMCRLIWFLTIKYLQRTNLSGTLLRPDSQWARSLSIKYKHFISLGPGRPSAGGPRMNHRAVTCPGVAKISRLALTGCQEPSDPKTWLTGCQEWPSDPKTWLTRGAKWPFRCLDFLRNKLLLENFVSRFVSK